MRLTSEQNLKPLIPLYFNIKTKRQNQKKWFCLLVLMMGLGFLMDCIFFGLQAGLADAIDTYFYVLNQARKGSLHGLGVHIKTLRNNHIDGTC
jgi:hypothetical protein